MARPRALIFDVFGSLVDWRTSVAREMGAVLSAKGLEGDPVALAVDWRAEYQPGMERIRSGGRGYVPLDVLHRENLERVLERHRLREYFDEEEMGTLARCWERLDPWPDVVPGLSAARRAGFLVAPCSNGSIALMAHLARYAGFHWDAIVGAELARDYKPKRAVYEASCAALGCAPGEVMMVAAHNDDLAAARAAGVQTGFFARPTEHGPEQTKDLRAESDWDVVAQDLPGLIASLPPA